MHEKHKSAVEVEIKEYAESQLDRYNRGFSEIPVSLRKLFLLALSFSEEFLLLLRMKVII